MISHLINNLTFCLLLFVHRPIPQIRILQLIPLTAHFLKEWSLFLLGFHHFIRLLRLIIFLVLRCDFGLVLKIQFEVIVVLVIVLVHPEVVKVGWAYGCLGPFLGRFVFVDGLSGLDSDASGGRATILEEMLFNSILARGGESRAEGVGSKAMIETVRAMLIRGVGGLTNRKLSTEHRLLTFQSRHFFLEKLHLPLHVVYHLLLLLILFHLLLI